MLVFNISLISLFLVLFTGCGGGNGSSGNESNQSGNSQFSEIAALSIYCDSEEGSPESCSGSQNGKPVLLGWTSNSCSSINWSSLAAIENATLSCFSTFCEAHDSVDWKHQSLNETVWEIDVSNRTAVAWLNFVDHGANDNLAPQSGDVVCCDTVATQTADSYADIQPINCSSVP